MPRSNKTFSDTDVLRFIEKNLTKIERDTVICTILVTTGHLKGGLSAKNTLSTMKTLLKGANILGTALGIYEATVNEGFYSPDY